LIIAIRDRFVGAITLALLAATGAAMFLGASTIAEQQALGLAYAGELVRFILTLGLITFVCFHVRRMHETHEIEAILSRPISRAVVVLAYFFAYAVIALGLALVAAPLLMLGLGAHGAGLAQWDASLMLEGVLIVALSLFCAMTLESATASVMASAGLYLLGRSAAFFRAIAESGTGSLDHPALNTGARWVMEAIAAVMPRIDLFGQSRWLVTGPGGGWGLGELLVQTAIYVPLLLLATIRDLQIKRF
jgi:hypothetical protein